MLMTDISTVPSAGPLGTTRPPGVDNLLDALPECALVFDADTRLRHLNRSAELLLGVSAGILVGQPIGRVLPLLDGVTRRPIDWFEQSCSATPFSGAFPLLICPDGRRVPVLHSLALAATDNVNRGDFLVLLREATPLQRFIDDLSRCNRHDEQTRLLRRGELIRRLAMLLQDATAIPPHAFFHIDIDDCNAINDQAGHAVGDAAILQVAHRLQNALRHHDALARLGGDEFGLLLPACPGARAQDLALLLHHAVANSPWRHGETDFRLGVSIGVAILNSSRHHLQSVLTIAGNACKRAKAIGGSRPRIFAEELD